eukprot:Stramenopile-MAST_4_protein_6536
MKEKRVAQVALNEEKASLEKALADRRVAEAQVLMAIKDLVERRRQEAIRKAEANAKAHLNKLFLKAGQEEDENTFKFLPGHSKKITSNAATHIVPKPLEAKEVIKQNDNATLEAKGVIKQTTLKLMKLMEKLQSKGAAEALYAERASMDGAVMEREIKIEIQKAKKAAAHLRQVAIEKHRAMSLSKDKAEKVH